jgi:hypothetical protein
MSVAFPHVLWYDANGVAVVADRDYFMHRGDVLISVGTKLVYRGQRSLR